MARAISLAELTKIADAQAQELIKPLLSDEDDRVRYQAAIETHALGSPDCLPTYISLLDSSFPYRKWGLYLRFRSIQALKRITRTDLGYRAGMSPEVRKPYLEAWDKWLKNDAPKVTLNF